MSRKKTSNPEPPSEAPRTQGLSLEDQQRLFKGYLDQVELEDVHLPVVHSPGNPGNPGVGSRVLNVTDWVDRQQRKASAAGDDWASRALTPRKDPIDAARKADKKRKSRLEEAEKKGKWLAKMGKLSFDDYASGVQAVGASGYTDGVTRKKAKVTKAVTALQPLVEGLAKSIDAMPQDTDTQREDRMKAARRGMISIGDKLAGVTTTTA